MQDKRISTKSQETFVLFVSYLSFYKDMPPLSFAFQTDKSEKALLTILILPLSSRQFETSPRLGVR